MVACVEIVRCTDACRLMACRVRLSRQDQSQELPAIVRDRFICTSLSFLDFKARSKLYALIVRDIFGEQALFKIPALTKLD